MLTYYNYFGQRWTSWNKLNRKNLVQLVFHIIFHPWPIGMGKRMALHFGAEQNWWKQQLLLSQKLFHCMLHHSKERWKLKGLGHQGNIHHPSPTHPHALFLDGYWFTIHIEAAGEQIFSLDPPAFIMAPWWRMKKESNTIISPLTLLAQHTWWASGGGDEEF